MFADNKYTRWYYKVIAKATAELRVKTLPGQFDKHHIIPTCLGGDDKKSNLVLLTPREHYMCHLLLIKMTSGKHRSKMVYAFFRFSPKGSGVATSKSYERFLDKYRASLKGSSNAFFGRKHSDATKAMISKNHGMRGTSYYAMWVETLGLEEANIRRSARLKKQSEAMSGSKNHAFGKPRTTEQRSKHSRMMTGAGNPNFGKDWAWISKGGTKKRVLMETLTDYLLDGWTPGMKS